VIRTAIVTGANRGIGLEIARQLADRGFRVVVGARDTELGSTVAAELPGDAWCEQIDVTDAASVAACAARLDAQGVAVDVLVNNAGIYTTTPLLEIDEPALFEALQVNLLGAWRTSRAFVPGMRQRGWAKERAGDDDDGG
jgi:NAD(P)-dependent dehydrogenase (short-subunit alcohol dehydrogenase family)